MTKELNLNLPENSLKKIINDNKYLEFIFCYIKLKIFFIFYLFTKQEFEEFVQIYKYLDDFFKDLKNDNECEDYEKISILFHFVELFNEFRSYKIFHESNFRYIKAKKAKNNSSMKLALDFLEKYINNLNEESPQYFKLVEINSDIGSYQGSNIFTYDIIDIDVLKSHLREAIPSIICFYSYDNCNNFAFTSPEINGICVNEAKIFKYCEKFKIDVDCFNERKFDVKNVAMKLSLNIIFEVFGYIKYKTQEDFCHKKINSTPRKCFDNKKLKKLVGVNEPIKKKTINILANPHKSDSGHYLESSLGKLPGKKHYTSVYLSCLKNIGNLLDHPELFYNKDYLEILQKYSFYKYVFEKTNERKENKNKEEEEKKYKAFSFKDEFEFLNSFYSKNQYDSIVVENEEISEKKNENKIKTRKFLKIKRKISNFKKNDETKNNLKDEKEGNKRKISSYNITDRNKIINIILSKNLNASQKEYYLKILFDNLHKS